MKRKQRWIYYCDFCKKHYHLQCSCKKHEEHCTMNPDRVCGICSNQEIFIDESNPPLYEMIKDFRSQTTDQARVEDEYSFTITGDGARAYEVLRGVANGCPACMLAIMRQCPDRKADWNYKKEKELFWSCVGNGGGE